MRPQSYVDERPEPEVVALPLGHPAVVLPQLPLRHGCGVATGPFDRIQLWHRVRRSCPGEPLAAVAALIDPWVEIRLGERSGGVSDGAVRS